jgi:hypothetical protein
MALVAFIGFLLFPIKRTLDVSVVDANQPF